MQSKTFLRSIVAVLVAAAPLTGYGRDNNHHDGHHGDRSSDHGHDHGHGNYHGHGSYYGHGGSYYGRGYYGRGYYGSYYSPYYYGRPYWGPSFGLSFYSRPNYAYRGYVVDDHGGGIAADVQVALRRQGYYRGPIDGSIGPVSRGAIRAYQANRRLNVTGRIDRTLVHSLGID